MRSPPGCNIFGRNPGNRARISVDAAKAIVNHCHTSTLSLRDFTVSDALYEMARMVRIVSGTSKLD